jgi:hypothetical protein
MQDGDKAKEIEREERGRERREEGRGERNIYLVCRVICED